MTYQRETDPEVLADLRLRDESERDRTRSSAVTCECGHHVRDHHGTIGLCMVMLGEDLHCRCEQFARASGPRWAQPVIVERWPCTGCNALVEMTAEALGVFEQMNRQLAKRGERSLPRRIPCSSCKAREVEQEQARRRPHEQRLLPGADKQNRRRNA